MASIPESLSINEILPSEILGLVFEEHALLEWRAPATDGQVCRFWRQTVLHHPRAWSHIEIHNKLQPDIHSLRLWLSRSGSTPFSFSDHTDRSYDGHISTLYDVLSEYHDRIEFLRTLRVPYSFFDGRAFPALQVLDVEELFWHNPSGAWGSMPKLRTLRIGSTDLFFAPLDDLPPLTVLVVYETPCLLLVQKSHNVLTTLMLDDVLLLKDSSSTITFPSLTYLSLSNVPNLKPHMVTPALVTYHEGGCSASESFPMSLPSLVEYGLLAPCASLIDPAELHHFFPHISRLSIRTSAFILPSIVESLAKKPDFLPNLQIIAVAPNLKHSQVPQRDIRDMMDYVFARNLASGTHVTLCIGEQASIQVPLFFGAVRYHL